MTLDKSWHNIGNPPDVNQLRYLSIHKYVLRDYIPFSRFVVIKPEYINDVAALLLLCGHKIGGNRGLLSAGKWWVSPTANYMNKSLYKDLQGEWTLTGLGLVALGVIKGD